MTRHPGRIVLALLMPLAVVAQAQTIRGSVVDQRDAPVPGVVVQLLDPQSAIVAHALSNERGEYRLTAPSEGTYGVRTQRIGFRPMSYGPFALRAGEVLTERLVLTGLPVTLTTVSVTGRNSCRALNERTSETYLVWEQVRTALSAAQITAGAQGIASTTLTYEGVLDLATDSIREHKVSVQVANMTEPWRAISADSLRRFGYVVTGRDDSTTFHAPDLEVLLSDRFLEDHCFRIAESSDSARVGIAFEPTPARRRIPEIRGTLWVDRRSSELQQMTFRYANIPSEGAAHAAGSSEFVRMAGGAWVISQWEIRMPLLERRPTGPPVGRNGPRTLETHTAGVKLAGGQLLSVRQGDDTLWSRPRMLLTGVVSDSASRPTAAARISLSGPFPTAVSDAAGRFTIADVMSGVYTVEVRTPSLDSISVVHETRLGFTDAAVPFTIIVPSAAQVAATLCRDSPAMQGPGAARGIIAGRVSASGAPSSVRNIKVVAEWEDKAPAVRGSADGGGRFHWIATRSDARGMFRICGAPSGVSLMLWAEGAMGNSRPVPGMIPAGQSYVYVSLALDSAVIRGGASADARPDPPKLTDRECVLDGSTWRASERRVARRWLSSDLRAPGARSGPCYQLSTR